MLPRSASRLLFSVLLGLAVLSAAGCGGAEARKAKYLEKGQAFLAAGNLEKARVEFRNALQIAPKDVQARFEMGMVDEALGNPREAAQFYQGTIDVSPDHPGARSRLARLYLFSANPDQALELIKPALDKHPDDADLLTIRAAALQQKKDVGAARIDAERAVQLAPTNEGAVAVLAGVYTSTGEKDKARTLLEQTIAKNPASVDLRLVLAQLYAQDNRAAEAEALLLKVIELKPKEKAYRLQLVRYYARMNQVDAAEHTLRQAIADMPADRDLKFSLIDFLAQRRDRDAAEKEFKKMIAAQPGDEELKLGLGKFYTDGHQAEQAEAVYQSVIDAEKLEPNGLVARDRLAALRADRNDLPGALALVNAVLAKSPRDDDALFLRGNIDLAKQDPRSAIADLRAVLRDQPNAIGALRALARAHLANGEPAVAEETMRHALDANPKDLTLRLEFAQLLMQMDKADQAKPLLAEVVKQQPDNVAALGMQFRAGMATKDFATAKSAADAMVAIRPKSATGYLSQGMIAEAENHNDDAIRLYAAAVEVQPDAIEPLQAEMRLLVAAKRGDEALKRLEAFSVRYPENPLGLDAQGEILLRDGKIPQAQGAFKAAIARSPKWWVPYRDLAAAQLTANDTDAAVDTLTKAKPVVDQPDAIGMELASVLQRLGKWDAAIVEYDEVLHRAPGADLAANNLAMLLATYKKDAASLDRAKALTTRFADSANPSFLDTYGWVLYKRGETAASVPVLERVVAKVPNEPVARYHLGMAQSQLGSSAEARDNLSLAVNSGRKFSGLDEAKATLDKLPKPTAAVAPKT
jgi:tetratricopeptide (TPR) repeat protein